MHEIFYYLKRAWVPHKCAITKKMIWPGQKAYKKEVYRQYYYYDINDYIRPIDTKWLAAPGYMFEKLKQGYDIPDATVYYPD